MKIKIVTGATILEAIDNLLGEIPATEESFIVVPDRATLQIEEMLFDRLKLTSTFNLNVVGLSNLAFRYTGVELNPLSEIESVLFVKKAIENKKENLKYFKSTNINFCKEVYKLISQFKSSGLKPSEIKALSKRLSLQKKTEDMRIIYEEFEALTADRADPSELLDTFAEVIENEKLFSETNFFFTGFDSFTAKHYELLKVLCRHAKSVVVSQPKAGLTQGNAYIYENDIFEKIKKLAMEENQEVEVISPASKLSGGAGEISRQLFASNLTPVKENKVRFFEGRTKKAEAEFVAKMIAYEVYHGARYRDFAVAASDLKAYGPHLSLAFEKNGIPYYSDLSENAAKSYCALVFNKILTLAYKNFRKNDLVFIINSPFFNFEEEETSFVNDKFEGGAKAFHSYKGLSELKELVEKINKSMFEGALNLISFLEERLDAIKELNLDEKTLSIEIQVPQILREIVEASAKTIKADSFSELLSSIEIGLETKSVSAIPSYYDQVYVGDVTDSFFGKTKNLFVMGASAGAMPKAVSDNSIFSDEELEEARFARKVEPSIKMINRRNRFKLFSLLTCWENRLYVTYPLVGEDDKSLARSMVANQLLEIFDKENSIIRELIPDNISKLEQLLLAIGKSKIGAEEALSGASNPQIKGLLKAALMLDEQKFKRLKPLACAKELKLGAALKPTEIEKFYDCPFKVVCENLLSLKEKRPLGITPLQVGSITHYLLENYGKQFRYAPLDEKTLDEFVTKQLKDSYDFSSLPDGDLHFYKLKKDLKKICKIVSSENEKSPYKPYLLEEKVETKFEGKPFYGRADRVDKCGEFFRLLDYKTGHVTTNLVKDLSFGKKLQLFAYAKCIADKTSLKCGGIYYFNVQPGYSNKPVKPLVGLSVEEAKEFYAADKYISAEELESLQERAQKLMTKAADYMAEGRLLPYPDAGSCEYCKYKSICLYDKERGIRMLKGGKQ